MRLVNLLKSLSAAAEGAGLLMSLWEYKSIRTEVLLSDMGMKLKEYQSTPPWTV